MSGKIPRKKPLGAAAPCPRGVESLSPREQDILELLARGFMYKEIAQSLGIRVVTVNTHIRRIYEKLHVRSRGQAVARYVLKPLREEQGAAKLSQKTNKETRKPGTETFAAFASLREEHSIAEHTNEGPTQRRKGRKEPTRGQENCCCCRTRP